MKISNLFIALLLFNFSWAQTTVNTTIREATVFLQSAQITRTGKATIPKGRGSVVLTGLSPQLDQSSVRFGATGDFMILTVTPQSKTIEPNLESPEYLKLDGEKTRLTEILARQQIKVDALKEEEKYILANKANGNSESRITVAELQQMGAFLRTRLSEIKVALLDLSNEVQKDKKRLSEVTIEMSKLRQKGRKNIAEVVVQYQAERSVNAEFQLTYLINGTSWTPTYDLRVEDLSKPVELSYGALVNQSTGEDWKNIELTLSTGNPRQQQNAPKIRTWWLSPNQPIAYAQKRDYAYEEEIVQSNMVISRSDIADANFAGADVSVNMTNTEFKVRLAQDIPSNGQQYRVLVDDYELPADFQYYAAPKYDCHVYLTALISDWQKYSLMPGQVNLFFDGAYVGKSNLQTHTATDTLTFSLGRDKGITIEREREEDYRNRKLFGSKIEQRIGWKIKVMKNRKNDVPLIIEDQIPVSTTDEIEVTLEQSRGANYDEKTGKLRWELKMGFGDKKEIGFRYTVKHPKNMALRLE